LPCFALARRTPELQIADRVFVAAHPRASGIAAQKAVDTGNSVPLHLLDCHLASFETPAARAPQDEVLS